MNENETDRDTAFPNINKYNIEIKKEEKIGAQGLTVRPLVVN